MNSELQNLFDQAVEAQSQGKDSDALSIYNGINSKGYTSASIELNKSLLYEKQEDWGRALSSIEKAQILGRNPWLGQDRLERIQKEIGSNRAYSIGSLGEMTSEVSKIIRPTESLFIASLFIGVYLIVRAIGFRNRIFLLSLFFALLCIIFSSFAFFSDKTKYLITDAELRTVPLEEAASKMNLGKGAKVIVLKENGKFLQVSRPGDFTGWIPSSSITE